MNPAQHCQVKAPILNPFDTQGQLCSLAQSILQWRALDAGRSSMQTLCMHIVHDGKSACSCSRLKQPIPMPVMHLIHDTVHAEILMCC